MSDVTTLYFSTPPVARTVATAVFVASVGVYTGMLSIYGFFFHYSMLLKFPPAIHRLVTSFLITSKDLGVLFDTYFVYNYLSQLEKGNAKFSKKADLIWYLMFVSGVIILVNQLFTGAVLYLHGLLIAICYTATQDQRGMQAHFYVVTVPAQLMPWCMLLAQLLFAGWGSFLLGLTGIFAAHLHDFLTRIYPEFGHGVNLIPTPGFISWILATPRMTNMGYGTSITPRSGSSGRGGPLPDSWRSKGPGRRLG
ncbi:Der1-like family protein [Xylaria bambusicola]|uniref:Der1-like family protein n=1 Tax=Xylaria bambusicola TaxID=326684 RepID=UPI002008C945|nr:Der1-like family protein [Xylaria bambusicola]KAI0525372.1 Der1-like family protein [Xylaria bambusicola]